MFALVSSRVLSLLRRVGGGHPAPGLHEERLAPQRGPGQAHGHAAGGVLEEPPRVFRRVFRRLDVGRGAKNRIFLAVLSPSLSKS